MSTLALGPADALASAAARKPKPSLWRRLIAAREEQAKRRAVTYLAWMDDERLESLGFTAENIRALRNGRLGLPIYE